MGGVRIIGDRYRLIEYLGTGSTSVVWRGHDDVLGRPVAVKVLAAALTANPNSRRMIRAEAQAAARTSHPHIAGVYDYGESTTEHAGTVPYIVMELINGPSLEQRLANGRLPWRAALRIGAQVAAAIDAAHARGLVHRDVKPSNIMLDESGAKVVDFGIAAVAGQAGEQRFIMGTPAYLAPERLAGEPVRPATDVYALGVLLYRALTGNLPWQADTTRQLLRAHASAAPVPLPVVDGLPDHVAALCLRCLAKDPAARPTSREVARTLAAAAGIHVPLADDGAAPAAAVSARRAPKAIGRATVPRPRRLTRRRLVRVGTTAAVVGTVLLFASWPHLANNGQDEAVASIVTPERVPAPCAVRYLVQADVTGTFDVDVTVTNNGPRRLSDWTLEFAFAGNQILHGSPAGEWTQSPAGTVTIRNLDDGRGLGPRASVNGTFTRVYASADPLPTSFTVDGLPCSYVTVDGQGRQQTGDAQTGLSQRPDVKTLNAGADNDSVLRHPPRSTVPDPDRSPSHPPAGEAATLLGTPAASPTPSGTPGPQPSCGAAPPASPCPVTTPTPTPTRPPTGTPTPTSPPTPTGPPTPTSPPVPSPSPPPPTGTPTSALTPSAAPVASASAAAVAGRG